MNGYLFLLAHLLLESSFPIMSHFAMKTMPILWVVTFSTFIALIFGVVMLVKFKLYTLYKNKEIVKYTFLSSLFLGAGTILYFFGIKYSSPSIAATLILLQSFFAFIIFNLMGHEAYNYKQVIGAVLAFIGGVVVVYDGNGSFVNAGAMIMVLACFIYTVGNFYIRKATAIGTHPFFLLVNRSFLMVIVTAILAFVISGEPDMLLLKENFIWIFLIGSAILFLSKIMWIQSISRLNPFVAISSFPIISILVLILSYFILDDIPTTYKILGFIPIIFGSYLLVQKNRVVDDKIIDKKNN